METEPMTFNMLQHAQTFHAYSIFWQVDLLRRIICLSIQQIMVDENSEWMYI
ncbi:hypothetical protein T229_07695 [Tannerella sp. oral taxon BU063 isolate Cell 5]|uniref:Uncharacterized protein n=1 Tax=Tannerella sp. oral taxon BU063 isolate Cell 5 TaxID=1410950 RepID=W2CCB3_9BACT|nr:hypothetical protein T229_07695 [Tannerella sp. oral taxon BU063 isolate Cell 5]